MTMLDTPATQAGYHRRDRRENALGLYIAVVKESPRASEAEHKRAFKRLVLQEGYEDFVEAIIDEWQSIKYSTAARAAQPPSVQEIKKKAEKRKAQRQKEESATMAAKELIGARLLDLVMPNGKRLRECTGADCIKFGGLYTRIGEKVGPRRIVGKVLSPVDLASLSKAK